LSVVSYAAQHSVRPIGLAVTATATVERAQLFGRWSRQLRYTICRWAYATVSAIKIR